MSLAFRGRELVFFAVFALFCAIAPGSSAEASCGKGYIVVPAGYGGAVVDAIVAKHRKAYAEQTNQRTPRPACTGPGCRDNPSVPHQTLPLRVKITTKTEAAFGVAAVLDDHEAGAFVRDPDEAIYAFEVAPPPTPPPNGFLVRAII